VSASFELIPAPRELRRGEGGGRYSGFGLEELPAALTGRTERHLRELLEALEGDGDAPRAMVTLTHRPSMAEQSYELRVDGDRVEAAAGSPAGALLAIRTLKDLWQQTSPWLPNLLVRDQPDLQRRGIFVESFAVTDRMALEDWCEFAELLATLKLNAFSFSIYGCWDLRHDGGLAEYLFMPLPDHPKISTPQRLVTWDPVAREEVVEEYLPRMFADDFFDQLVERLWGIGMEPLPVIGGPGHNSLIPRRLPEVSAKTAAGEPKGYGYCVSAPAARDGLTSLFRALAERRFRPNGIRVVGCAGDEFYPIKNFDPNDRERIVSPECECPKCSRLSRGDQLTEYLALASRTLAESGIGTWIWHDSVEREGVTGEFRARAQADGAPEPIVCWWKYSEPLPRPESGAANWVMPTTGLFPMLFHQDTSDNIAGWLRLAGQTGADGAIAYGLPDPGLHQNVACLAEMSWNTGAARDPDRFKARWARYVAGDDSALDARQAYSLGESVLGCQPLMIHLIDHLLPYFAVSSGSAARYPEDVVRSVGLASPAMGGLLAQVGRSLRRAAELMPHTRELDPWPAAEESWNHALLRLVEHIEITLGIAALGRRLYGESIDALRPEIEALAARGEEFLARVAAMGPGYLREAQLREHWYLVKEITPALERMAEEPSLRPPPLGDWHAWII
jgi:hypothetical protein